jgi:uncharacterized protein (UPF0333 family)
MVKKDKILMKKLLLVGVLVFASINIIPQVKAQTTVLTTVSLGYYNNAIGNALNGIPAFNGGASGYYSSPPNISPADSILGGWLNTTPTLNSNWSPLQSIPTSWAVNTEDAIVYPLDLTALGASNVEIRVGVDNGAFIWLNGNYIGGDIREGTAVLGELVFNVNNVPGTINYLQILREDHGVTTDYSLQVNAVGVATPAPEPATLSLLTLGSLVIVFQNRLKGKRKYEI